MKNYKTEYVGTPRDLEQTTTLILVQSSNFNISMDTLGDLPEDLLEAGKYEGVRVSNRSDGDYFDFYLGDEELFDFDVILYHNQVSGFVGYTIFSGLQHCYSSDKIPFKILRISLVFNRVEGEGTGDPIDINVVLNPLTVNKKILGEEKRYQYSEVDTPPKSDEGENYLRFTNRPQDFRYDQELSILTDSGIITHTGGFSGLFILSGVDADLDLYKSSKIVYYQGDLGILKFSWETGEFCVSSVTTQNPFGRPLDYLSGILRDDYKRAKSFYGGTGNFLVFSDDRNYIVYPLKEPTKPVIYPKDSDRNSVVIDPWDIVGDIRYTTEEEIKREISTSCYIPSDFGIYSFKEKIGPWWKFFASSRGYLYVSVYGIVKSQVELNFINSRIAFYFEDGKYVFLPIEIGCSISYPFQGIKCVVNPDSPMSSLDIELKYLLNGLRRKPFRTKKCLPHPSEFVGCGGGMIFYQSEGLLYCY